MPSFDSIKAKKIIRYAALFLFGCSFVAGAWRDYGDLRNIADPHTKTHFAPLAYRSLEEWTARQQTLRKQILTAAGLDPFPIRNDLKAHRFGKIERPQFTVEKVSLETFPGFLLAGNLYLPKNGGNHLPAILVLHGHWKHGRVEDTDSYSVPALCANLAAQGYVVFTHDMVGYNDTQQLPHRFGGTRLEQLWSFHPMGIQLWNAMRALDFLESLGEVDANRIGVTGASGGGTQTFLLSAVDDRVKVSAPVVMVSATFQGDDVCELAPQLRIGTNNLELAALMAPRPLILISSSRDWTKNTPKTEFPAIQSIYRLYGKAELVEYAQVQAKHNYNSTSRQAMYGFFNRHLKGDLGRGLVWREIRQLNLKPSDLLLEPDKGRVAGTEAAVFAQWRMLASQQTEGMAEESLVGLLSSAVGAVWPERVNALPAGERILLERDGSGERVPALWMPNIGSYVAVVVDDQGSEEARRRWARTESGLETPDALFVDVFQIGLAEEPRHRPRKDFLTFHRSDDANRVQDILTALAFAAARQPEGLRLICTRKASAWCWLAAALSPIKFKLVVDSLDTNGAMMRESALMIPGLRKAGGFGAIQRVAIWRDGERVWNAEPSGN